MTCLCIWLELKQYRCKLNCGLRWLLHKFYVRRTDCWYDYMKNCVIVFHFWFGNGRIDREKGKFKGQERFNGKWVLLIIQVYMKWTVYHLSGNVYFKLGNLQSNEKLSLCLNISSNLILILINGLSQIWTSPKLWLIL